MGRWRSRRQVGVADTATFRLGIEFPHEGFVQESVRRYFESEAYINTTNCYVDVAFQHPINKEQWGIEAKGHTSQVGLDFRTGLGQCIQGMSDEATECAIAFPATDQFLCQGEKIPAWIRCRLNLHWVVVHSDGTIRIVNPNDEL